MIIQRAIADADWILDKVRIKALFNINTQIITLQLLTAFFIYSIPRRSEVHKTWFTAVDELFLGLSLECFCSHSTSEFLSTTKSMNTMLLNNHDQHLKNRSNVIIESVAI